MRKLGETLALDRNRIFVGREAELAAIREWMRETGAPTEIRFVTGIGGIGKSSLMLKALDMAEQAGLTTVWMDGRVCPETPAGFLAAVLDNMKMGGVLPPAASSLQHIGAGLSNGKALLCIDNYDGIHRLDSWLREVFLPRLPAAGLLVMLVSRSNPSEPWLHDLAWRRRVRVVELAPFTRQELVQYLFRTGVDKPPDADRWLEETRGLPLALALHTEKLRLPASGIWPLSMRISAELIREVTAPELLETVELLCILPEMTAEWLYRLLSRPPDAERLLQLGRISFVRPTRDGFALHDVARYYLLEELTRRDAERLRQLRIRIVRELTGLYKTGGAYDVIRLNAALLSVCRDAFQLDSVSILPHRPEQRQMEIYQPGDLPHLLRMVEEQAPIAVSVANDIAVLKQLAETMPDSIRVFRSAGHAPIAFVAGFYLYRDTALFHEKFFPGVLRQAYPDEIATLRTLPMERADTYYQILAGVADNHPEFASPELIGIIMADCLIMRSAGLRTIIINTYEGLDEILLRIGYRIRALPGLPGDHPFFHAKIKELDWRHADMSDRIRELFGLHGPDRQVPFRKMVTDKALRAALPIAGDSRRLALSELARILERSGDDLHGQLHKLLWSEPVYPLEERHQRVLRQLSRKPQLTSEQAADDLHVSRATYFRLRAEALRLLRDALSAE